MQCSTTLLINQWQTSWGRSPWPGEDLFTDLGQVGAGWWRGDGSFSPESVVRVAKSCESRPARTDRRTTGRGPAPAQPNGTPATARQVFNTPGDSRGTGVGGAIRTVSPPLSVLVKGVTAFRASDSAPASVVWLFGRQGPGAGYLDAGLIDGRRAARSVRLVLPQRHRGGCVDHDAPVRPRREPCTGHSFGGDGVKRHDDANRFIPTTGLVKAVSTHAWTSNVVSEAGTASTRSKFTPDSAPIKVQLLPSPQPVRIVKVVAAAAVSGASLTLIRRRPRRVRSAAALDHVWRQRQPQGG
jgi:hypothetical protein